MKICFPLTAVITNSAINTARIKTIFIVFMLLLSIKTTLHESNNSN
jgi:hypothetical protein